MQRMHLSSSTALPDGGANVNVYIKLSLNAACAPQRLRWLAGWCHKPQRLHQTISECSACCRTGSTGSRDGARAHIYIKLSLSPMLVMPTQLRQKFRWLTPSTLRASDNLKFVGAWKHWQARVDIETFGTLGLGLLFLASPGQPW
jgi:hypothetical protein